jgi:glycosyltransferase involved in cell wall biosynthesis
MSSVKQHVLVLLKYLNRARYKPYLVTSDDTYIAEHIKDLDVEYIVIPGISTATKLNVGGIVKQIQQFLEERKVNLVHTHGDQACFVGTHLAKALEVKHVSTVHTAEDTSKKKGLFGIQHDKVLTTPDRIIAISEDIRKQVEPLNEVRLIYNGIEIERFGDTLDTEHLFRELEVTKDHKMIGTVTELTPGSGIDVFLDAAAKLQKDDPEMHFIVAGDGDELDNLKEKAASLGIAKNAHFLGFRRDVAHILKSLNVVVIPNISTELPLALLEALASIKPVVISDTPGVREVVSEDSVEFVKPGDADAIVKAVSGLLSDADKANAKASAGQKLISGRFSVENMIKPTQSLYLEVAG